MYAKVRDHIGPGTVALCGARVGTPTQLSRDAEIDVCWDAGEEIPTGKDVVIEARERYFWDDAQPFRPWERVARGDSFTGLLRRRRYLPAIHARGLARVGLRDGASHSPKEYRAGDLPGAEGAYAQQRHERVEVSPLGRR